MSFSSPFILLIAACYGASMVFFYRRRYTVALLALLLGSFLLRIEMATLDPFLHNWDERFHALVAKNMMSHPFRPMLFKHPALPYDYTSWCCNHIWLHKQPLFLWQIALSMKIFGVNEFALRLPSVVMGTLMVFFTYRISKRVSGNDIAAYFAALFFSLSWYQLELTSGLTSLDHNDIAFAFYILASFWALSEYLRQRSVKWVLLIGLFAGAAILCKWLVGLLVYAGWGISVLLFERKNIQAYKDMIYALLVTVAVAVPWQIYIINAFPRESAYEYAYNTRHLFEVLEGHDHAWWFYFQIMPLHYGAFLLPFLVAGLFMLLARDKRSYLAVSVFASFWIVYLFFSMVATRLQAFTFIAAPFAYLCIGLSISRLYKAVEKKHTWATMILLLLVAALALYCMRPGDIREERNWTNLPRNHKAYLTSIYKSLPDSIQGKKTVVFNTRELGNLELMFYRDVVAYDHFPPAETLDSLARQGFRLYALPNFDSTALPGFVQERSFVQVIPVELKK